MQEEQKKAAHKKNEMTNPDVALIDAEQKGSKSGEESAVQEWSHDIR